MKATRRDALISALAVPAVAGLPGLARARGAKALVLHDPALAAGRRLAELHGAEALAIEGDRIRFARAVFEKKPGLVVGVSRHADALLIEDVAREAGYIPVDTGSEALAELIDAARPRDRGLVIGWVLSPRA